MEHYEIKIDFQKDTTQPARIFHSMAGIIDSFGRFDHELLDSVDLPLSETTLLHDIDIGSLRAILRWILNAPDSEALRDGDWKKLVGRMIDDGRQFLLRSLEQQPQVTDKRQLKELQDGFQEISLVAHTNLFPHAAPIPLHRILATIQSFESSTRILQSSDSAIYISEQRYQLISKDIFVSPELEEELLEVIPVSQPTRIILPVKKPDLIGNSQWDLYLQGKVIRAKILDTAWLGDFHDRSVELKSGDALDAILEVTLLKTAEDEFVGYRYQVLKVFEVKKRVRYIQPDLPEGTGEP